MIRDGITPYLAVDKIRHTHKGTTFLNLCVDPAGQVVDLISSGPDVTSPSMFACQQCQPQGSGSYSGENQGR